ncbi:MAG: 4a-hydroxytetrahydrobiopterin dehydratase [Gaiellales bacterium]|jgi:4a-hydroxytetrahydrobiopterin dehydratase
MAVLESSELEAEVAKLPGWEVREGALEKSFKRGDFNGSMAFLNRIAEAADAADHHPDVSISWDTVTLRWVSHSAGGITAADVRMAGKSDGLAG